MEKEIANTKLADLRPNSAVTDLNGAASLLVIQEAKSKREAHDPPVTSIRGAALSLVIQVEAKPKKTTRIPAAPVAVIVELLKDIKSEQALIRSELGLVRTDLQHIVSKQEEHDNHLAKLEQLISARNAPDIDSISEHNRAHDYHKPELIPRCDTNKSSFKTIY